MGTKRYPLELLVKALDEATEPLRKINAQIDSMNRPVKDLQKSFSDLSRQAGLFRLQKSLVGVRRAGGEVFDSLKRAGLITLGLATAAGGAAYGLFKLVKHAADVADALNDLSNVTGISVENLQAFSFVAQTVGVSAEGFTKGITVFAKSMGELKIGSGKLFSLLRAVDPAFLKVLKSSRNTEESFDLLIKRMRSIKNESARLVFASAAFGKSGGMFANLAKLSPEEFAKSIAEIKKSGLITKESAQKADAFNDAWTKVSVVFQNLKNAFAVQFFPVFTKLFKQFTDWMILARPQIEALGDRLAKELPGAIERARVAFVKLWPDIKKVFDMFVFLIEHTNALRAAFILLGAYILGPFVVSIFTLTKALIGLSTTLLTTPLGWFLLGLVGIGIAVKSIIDNWVVLKDSFFEFIKPAIEWVRELLALLERVRNNPVGAAIDFVKSAINPNSGGSRIINKASVPDSPRSIVRDANVTVKFDNVPKGVRVEQDRSKDAVDLDVGYQFSPGLM